MQFSQSVPFAPINEIVDPVLHLASPFSGKVQSLKQHPLALFSSGMIGRGVTVELTQGKVTAPFDGKIEQVKRHGYEIILVAKNGLKLLIHIQPPSEQANTSLQITSAFGKKEVKQGELLAYFETTHLEKPLLGSLLIVNADKLGPCFYPLKQVRAGLDPLITITQNQNI
jgi:phosphotransferase system IIA component